MPTAPTALRRHLERSLMPFATLVPPVLGAVGICLGPVVELLVPQYVPAIAPARLFLLSGAAVGVVNLAAVGAIAAGRQRSLPAFAALALVLDLGLSALALVAGLGLEGAAGAALAGNLLFAAAVVLLDARVTGVIRPGRLVGRALRSLLWCTAAVMVAGHGAAAMGYDAAAAIGIYLVLLLPLLPRCRSEWRRLEGRR